MANETMLTIVGNLTADVELRSTSSGAQVANFTIASTPREYDRQANEWKDGQALFIRCTAWRDLATHCVQTLSKGMRVIAQGRLQQKSYQAQDGSNRIVIEMTIDEIGSSLRYATAQVARQQSSQQSGGFAGSQPQSAAASNPWSQPQANDADPWANGGESEPAF